MFHIYTGDGKGKTTAAIGLALRAAASGKKVLFFQFLKSDTGNERKCLEKLDNITLINSNRNIPFLYCADQTEISEICDLYKKCICDIYSKSDLYDVFVFDEAVSAISENVISKDDILKFIPKGELIITGRGNIEEYKEMADYITEMKKIKHPYDKGQSAREGIEY